MRVRSALQGLLLLVVVGGMTLGLGCGPTYPECDSDENCADHNEYCVDNLCRECREDGHCNAQDGCKVCGAGYTCVTRPGCCHSDLDCPNGVCRKAPGSELGQCFGSCKDDSQCPAGQKCEGNMCVAVMECDADKPCPEGMKCVDGRCVEDICAKAIYFDFDEAIIRSDAKPILEANAECIKKAGKKHTIEGHCDERGTEEYNLGLGKRRAQAALKYLTKLGIKKDMLGTISYGEERPVCSSSGEDCWWRNRRAEFVFK